MTRFVSREAEMEENPILKASLSMASDIPLYAQLTGIIKNTITSGTLRVGDLLPSEAELCDKFEISRNTVRQAIGSLEEAGFVVRKRGKAPSSPIRARGARACSIRSRRRSRRWASTPRPHW